MVKDNTEKLIVFKRLLGDMEPQSWRGKKKTLMHTYPDAIIVHEIEYNELEKQI